MTNSQDELNNQAWEMAKKVYGNGDLEDFYPFVLGSVFYRYLSEFFTEFMNGGEDIDYTKLSSKMISPKIKKDVVKTHGFFIYPESIFSNVILKLANIRNLGSTLSKIFRKIENSSVGYPSESCIKGIFDDFIPGDHKLRRGVLKKRNYRLSALLQGVADLKIENLSSYGGLFEFLISKYFFNVPSFMCTPVSMSKLITALATHQQVKPNRIYDPTCGSGSLLLMSKHYHDSYNLEDGFFGQERSVRFYNFSRMNMLINGINYTKFNIKLGDTLQSPDFKEKCPFDVIVSDLPYSQKWTQIDYDDRFTPSGALAPKSKSDFAFVMHSLSYLSSTGRAALVIHPSTLLRGGPEKKIRKYLVDCNYIEAIVATPERSFYQYAPTEMIILVLSKHKVTDHICFIDATKLYTEENKKKIVKDEHRNEILHAFDSEENTKISYWACPTDIKLNDYDLSVNKYIN